MDENLAWHEFETTGKIDSYLRYRALKNVNIKYNEEIGMIKGDNSEDIQGKGNSN